MLAGLLAMCLGGLGAVVLYNQATTSRPVLVATRTIPRGETIKQSDLRVADVAGSGVASVEAERLSEVIDQVALLDIAEGTMLTPVSFGQTKVRVGTSQIGLRLTPGRVPVREMPAGTPVRLVAVAAKSDQGSAPPGEILVATATVVTAARATPDGSAVMLDVEVPADRAVVIAQLAAADRIVVVREPVK